MADQPKVRIPKPPLDPADLAWAKEKVKDVMFGCVLNLRLKQSGICKKFICEMTAPELQEYVGLISRLHNDS